MLHKYYIFGSFSVIVFDAYVNIYALKIDGVKSGDALLHGVVLVFDFVLLGLCLWLNYG